MEILRIKLFLGIVFILFASYSCSNKDDKLYDLYIQNLKEGISKQKKVFGDSLLIYNEYKGKQIGWEYLYKDNNLIRNGIRNLDTMENIFFMYSEDGDLKAKQVMMYSPILNENVLSEHCGEKFCDLITFNKPDTIYTNIGNTLSISFSLTESLNDFFRTCTISAVEYTPLGSQKKALLENVQIENNTFTLTPSKYGFIIVYFDVQDEAKRTRLFRRVFHIIPEQYKQYDWSFLE